MEIDSKRSNINLKTYFLSPKKRLKKRSDFSWLFHEFLKRW